MKLAIDKWQDISEKRRKANQQRTNIEQNLTKQEQNLTKQEQTVPKDKKEKIKDKKENILTLSKDNEEEKSSYGDEEINECLEIIKSYNNWIINWSSQKWRQYSKHLITKLKKIDNVKDWKIKWQDVLRMILEIWKENEYYSVKTTSPELIYYNLSTLMEVCRKQLDCHPNCNLVFSVSKVETLELPEKSFDIVCISGGLSCVDLEVR